MKLTDFLSLRLRNILAKTTIILSGSFLSVLKFNMQSNLNSPLSFNFECNHIFLVYASQGFNRNIAQKLGVNCGLEYFKACLG